MQIPDLSLLSLTPPPNMVVMLATMGCTDLLRVHMNKCKVCKKACSIDEGDPIQYKTAIKNALIGKWTEAASFLLDLNYNTNIDALVNGQTLLYGACYFRDVEMVKYLLSRGSDASISCDTDYEFPLHVAIALGFDDIIKILLVPGSENTERLFKIPRYDDGWTALHFAVESGRSAYERTRILKVLLKLAPRGAGLLDIKDVDGHTPLDLASQSGVESIEEVLLDFEMEEEDD
jgi:ankyrin repeat protein